MKYEVKTKDRENKIYGIWDNNLRAFHYIPFWNGAETIDLEEANRVNRLLNNQREELPQTDFTTIVAITKYDAKQFIGRIQSQIEILEMVNKKDEAKHWQELSRQAHLLFGITYNGTDKEVQRRIEREYNKSLKK